MMASGLQPQGSAGTSRLPLTSSRPGLWTTSTSETAAQICVLDMDIASRAPVCKYQQTEVCTCVNMSYFIILLWVLYLNIFYCTQGVFVRIFKSTSSPYFEGWLVLGPDYLYLTPQSSADVTQSGVESTVMSPWSLCPPSWKTASVELPRSVTGTYSLVGSSAPCVELWPPEQLCTSVGSVYIHLCCSSLCFLFFYDTKSIKQVSNHQN